MTQLESKILEQVKSLSKAQQDQVLQFVSMLARESKSPPLDTLKHRKQLVAILRGIADRGALETVNPVAWQREQRQERILPGR